MTHDSVEFTPESVRRIREELVSLRNGFLEATAFEWAVIITWAIEYLGNLAERMEIDAIQEREAKKVSVDEETGNG